MSIQPFEAMNPVEAAIFKAFDAALEFNEPLVRAHISRISKGSPGISSAELIDRLDNEYLAAISLMGATAGAAAVLPGVGTGASIALSALEMASFFEATCLYVMSLCLVHGVRIDDLARRRTLMLSLIIGQSAETFINKAVGRTGKHLGKQAVQSIPTATLREINKVLGRDFITKYGSKRGIVVLGTAIPFGIGALLGASMNGLMGYSIIRNAERVFGPPPSRPMLPIPA
jgi:hypothetical protein